MATVVDRGSGKATGAAGVRGEEILDEARPTSGDSPEQRHENAVLRRALQQAGKDLGLSEPDLAKAVGERPSFFASSQKTAPIASTTYLRIGLMLRLHESLSSLVGENVEHMRGWMRARNRQTGSIPAQQLNDPNQLEKLVCYFEALDGWA